MRSPKFTKHTLEKNGWKSVCFVWTMEFHSVTHAVLFSRGQVSMSLHLWFHLHWYGLHRFHMKRQSPVPSFTHIPKQDIVPKWKRAHREFNIVTHLSHSPLSFNQRFILFLRVYKRDSGQRTSCLTPHGPKLHHQVMACSRWLISRVALTRDPCEPGPSPGFLFHFLPAQQQLSDRFRSGGPLDACIHRAVVINKINGAWPTKVIIPEKPAHQYGIHLHESYEVGKHGSPFLNQALRHRTWKIFKLVVIGHNSTNSVARNLAGSVSENQNGPPLVAARDHSRFSRRKSVH